MKHLRFTLLLSAPLVYNCNAQAIAFHISTTEKQPHLKEMYIPTTPIIEGNEYTGDWEKVIIKSNNYLRKPLIISSRSNVRFFRSPDASAEVIISTKAEDIDEESILHVRNSSEEETIKATFVPISKLKWGSFYIINLSSKTVILEEGNEKHTVKPTEDLQITEGEQKKVTLSVQLENGSLEKLKQSQWQIKDTHRELVFINDKEDSVQFDYKIQSNLINKYNQSLIKKANSDSK